jgi:uncharacterized protein (TIGR00106 family)
MDKGESVGAYVARALDIIDRSGLPYKLGPLGTCIEGEWPEVMAVIQQCYEALAADSNRIACTVKMDWRRGQRGGSNPRCVGGKGRGSAAQDLIRKWSCDCNQPLAPLRRTIGRPPTAVGRRRFVHEQQIRK